MTTTDLETRLTAAEDRLALIDIEGAYGRLYDSRAAEAWAGLFTEDGVYQGRQLPGMAPSNLVQGRAALAAFCTSEPLSGMHFMHVPHLVIHGDSATGRVHFQFQATHTDDHRRQQSRSVTGYYDVRYVRTAEGWRIARRVTTYLESMHRTVHPYESVPFDLDEPLPDGAFRDARAGA